MKADKPIECVGCNTFDVGSILDNSERDANITRIYATQEEAQQALQGFTQKANEVAGGSESCQISSEINPVDGGYELNATFTFSCQAEVVIFQLANR